MKHSTIAMLVFVATATVGCSTVSMKAPSNRVSSQYAPQNDNRHVDGLVTYLDSTLDSTAQGRREDSYKQMFEQCNGKYVIKREYGSDSIPAYVNSDIGHSGFSVGVPISFKYVNIVFDCVNG